MNTFATVEDIRKALTISPKEISAGAADKIIWQVLFLPIDEVNNPTGYAAFCPFTKILAYGSTINEAAQRWTRKAQREYKYLGVYSPSFIIPKYSLTTRKVWLGNLPEDMIQEEHALRSQPQPKQRTNEDESGLDEDLLEEVAQERSIQSSVAQEDMPVFLVDWAGVKKGVAVWPARGAVSPVGLGQEEEEFSAANHVPRWAWLGTVMDWVVTATPAQSHSLPTAMTHTVHLRTGMTLTPNVIN